MFTGVCLKINRSEGQTAGFGPYVHFPIGQAMLEFRLFGPRPEMIHFGGPF